MQKNKSLTIKDAYPYYKEVSKKENRVDKKTYREINVLYNKFLMNKVIEGDTVSFFYRLGTLGVVGRKPKINPDKLYYGLSPNWKLTKELWDRDPAAKSIKKMIFNTNEHTEGIIYRFLWGKTNIPIPNKALYSLQICREYKRKLWRLILGGKEYFTKENVKFSD
jgi:hypothetical protein